MRHCPPGDDSDRQVRAAKGVCLRRVCGSWSYTRGSTTEWIRVTWSSVKGTTTQKLLAITLSQWFHCLLIWVWNLICRCCLREQTFPDWNSTVVEGSTRTWASADLSCLRTCILLMAMGKSSFNTNTHCIFSHSFLLFLNFPVGSFLNLYAGKFQGSEDQCVTCHTNKKNLTWFEHVLYHSIVWAFSDFSALFVLTTSHVNFFESWLVLQVSYCYVLHYVVGF